MFLDSYTEKYESENAYLTNIKLMDAREKLGHLSAKTTVDLDGKNSNVELAEMYLDTKLHGNGFAGKMRNILIDEIKKLLTQNNIELTKIFGIMKEDTIEYRNIAFHIAETIAKSLMGKYTVVVNNNIMGNRVILENTLSQNIDLTFEFYKK